MGTGVLYKTNLINVGKELATKTDHFEYREGDKKTRNPNANEVHDLGGMVQHRWVR